MHTEILTACAKWGLVKGLHFIGCLLWVTFSGSWFWTILKTTELISCQRDQLCALKSRSAHESIKCRLTTNFAHVKFLSSEPGNQIVSGCKWLILSPAIFVKKSECNTISPTESSLQEWSQQAHWNFNVTHQH
jgi:hypothetical protein